ncbi:MAG TPA: phosphotransferase [Acidimicrobiales bacterium]|nr:phosphotransferase [Acidimicrobiales bacterium]
MADPEGGPVVCHNDVCLENVVFRDGLAVALLDFDFAAPGRRIFDLAAFARMCIPIDDDVSAARLGWHPSDRPRRLRLVCDAYGLDAGGRGGVLRALDGSIARGGEFVRRRAEAGDPGFVKIWADMGGMERYDRRRAWWADVRAGFEAAVV